MKRSLERTAAAIVEATTLPVFVGTVVMGPAKRACKDLFTMYVTGRMAAAAAIQTAAVSDADRTWMSDEDVMKAAWTAHPDAMAMDAGKM